jgi:hypothetical protein
VGGDVTRPLVNKGIVILIQITSRGMHNDAAVCLRMLLIVTPNISSCRCWELSSPEDQSKRDPIIWIRREVTKKEKGNEAVHSFHLPPFIGLGVYEAVTLAEIRDPGVDKIGT